MDIGVNNYNNIYNILSIKLGGIMVEFKTLRVCRSLKVSELELSGTNW
jgi:hypothetical protein